MTKRQSSKPNRFSRTLLSLAILGAGSAPLYAQQSEPASQGIEEINVTATRRTESMQDVPIAVQALTTETLNQLDVSTIDDFIKYLPNVSSSNMGPAQGNIYMRGLSVGALGTQGTASVGAWPNVAVYLDDQSTQIPGRNLDVYAADLERIEVLEGPQGTLFGAGAQAGVLRYITNKPKLDTTEGSATVSYGMTEHGDDNGSAEGVINIPLIEGKMAARIVAFTESRGGYIDNVPSEFRRQGTDLGMADRACNEGTGIGTATPCVVDRNLSTPGVVPTDSAVINNNHVLGDDINDVSYKGMRASLLYRFNDDWDLLISQSFQDMQANGVFYQHPNGSDSGCGRIVGGSVITDCPDSTQALDDLEATLFNNNSTDDKFHNTAWTLNGVAGPMDVVYTGAYLKRESEQVQDYTNYARGLWAVYYQCTGFTGNSITKCYSPSSTWSDSTENTNQSHELRFTTPNDWRVRAVAGLFYEEREVKDDTDWRYKTVPECTVGGPGSCFLYLDPSQAPKFEGASLNNSGQRSSNTGFVDDFKRTYEQTAIFASVDIDIIPEVLTLTLGSRYYEMSNEMLGGNFGSFYCKMYNMDYSQWPVVGPGVSPIDGPCNGTNSGYGEGNPPSAGLSPYGTNLDAQDPHDDDVSDHSDRVNLSWNINEDIMVYATWSNGFRMGGFNRGPGAGYLKDASGVAQWYVPLQYDSDELTNIELGWKMMLFDRRLQLNGAVYQETWENVQTGIFAPQLGLGNLTVGLNGPEYEVQGVEIQFVAAATDNLTIQGSASYNDTELTNSPALINNNPASPTFGEQLEYAYVGGVKTPITNVYGEEGSEMANAPQLQANARARYEWMVDEYDAYVQLGFAYQDESPSSATVVNQFKTDAWTSIDMSAGIAKDQWSLELYGSNMTDEVGPVYTSATQWIVAEVPMRPRTISLRLGYRFGE